MKKMLSFLFIVLFMLETSCQDKSTKQQLKVAATSTPHAEILERIVAPLKEKNIDLNIIVIEDFNIPNRALAEKEVDANFFQHLPFLDLQNRELGYNLEPFFKVHIEPMGLYSKTINDLNWLSMQAKVAIPNDATNQTRALLLLEKANLIKLKQKNEINFSLLDIVENKKDLFFIELEASILPRILKEVDLAAINTNFAMQANLSPLDDALIIEDKLSQFVNIVAIRSGESNREILQIFKNELTSENLKNFIEEKYKGCITPAF
jgi:D-methionine transport system substrate-binding protein